MKLTTAADRWDDLRAHTGTHVKSAPWAVILAVAALVGDDEIKASWTLYEPDQPEGHTTWTEYIVTAERLSYAQLRFNAQSYDLDEDNDAFSRRNVTANITAAWARRLSDVTQLHIGSCAERLPENGPHDWVAIGGIRLIFNDGGELKFALDQRALRGYPQVIQRSDQFIAAIRSGAKI
jgi:hypothetical protein